MVTWAFSWVVRVLDSNWMSLAGTPAVTRIRRLISSSPRPLTMMRGAAPALNNSAARPGRSCKPPPRTTITSAFTGPLSTHRNFCGKKQAATASKASRTTTASKVRKITFLKGTNGIIRSRVQRAKILARAIIRAFKVGGAKRRPRAWTKHAFRRDVVHVNRNPQHRRQRDQVRPDVAVADRAVVRAPVVHHGIDIAEGSLPGQLRREPRGRPRGVRGLVKSVRN